ncbi:hypothetical protein [Janibacter limosus]|uniref:Uncharacterized protein n=1 Tax=Janibacter limosus TaxID=53458 RepID=A0A4P6MWH2_9MICO|nr:hypothetical protein [Janibacter limosus]QBF45743.1 hypothetical protein EXU32_05420 [Janibacter limosus]
MADFPVPSAPRPGPPQPLPSPPAATPAPTPASVEMPSVPDDGGSTPQTGDLVVDATLRDLAAVDPTDLDAVLTAGESVHATLTARLSDLGS